MVISPELSPLEESRYMAVLVTAFERSILPLFSASYPAVPTQVNPGFLLPSAIRPMIFFVLGLASTVTPVCIIASPFIT